MLPTTCTQSAGMTSSRVGPSCRTGRSHMKRIIGFVTKAVNSHWCAGVVSGLIIVDGLALVICAVDMVRFCYLGQSFSDASCVTWEKALQGEGIGTAVAVLMFFVI